MNSARFARHVRALARIAERRQAPAASYVLEIASSRTSPLSYVRRAVAILRASKGSA